MGSVTDRLERLLEDKLGECREEDLAERVSELDALGRDAGLGRAAEDARVFDALGSETRYRIVRILEAADDELCVCELTPLLSVSDSAVSHALSDLVDSGLVTRRTEGRWHYHTTTERASALLDAFDETTEDP